MVSAGLLTIGLGMSFHLKVHVLFYYVVIQVFLGIVQVSHSRVVDRENGSSAGQKLISRLVQ